MVLLIIEYIFLLFSRLKMDLTPGSEQEDFLEESVETIAEEDFSFVDSVEESVEVVENPAVLEYSALQLRPQQPPPEEEDEDQLFKAKYREAKKRFFKAVEKHEYLKSELQTRQKTLQQVEEDKYFLLERMLLYVKAPESPSGLSNGSDSESDLTTPGGGAGRKGGKFNFNTGGVSFSSAFSKMKSLSAGKKARRPAKAKLFDEVFDSPTVSSFGAFEDDTQGSSFLTSGIVYNRSAMDDSE